MIRGEKALLKGRGVFPHGNNRLGTAFVKVYRHVSIYSTANDEKVTDMEILYGL